MTRRAVAVGLGALVITTVAFVFANTAHAATSCAISNVVVYGSGKRATFTVQGSCTVSLVSYKRHGNGLATQTLFDSSTKEFPCATSSPGDSLSVGSAGSSRLSSPSPCSGELRIAVPDCEWQADLVLGQPRNPPTDYGNNVLGFRFGGEGQCPPPTTTTTSITTNTTTSTTASTPTTSVTTGPSTSLTSSTAASSTVSSTTAVIGTRFTPTDLAHTGSDSLPAIALGALGLIGAGRYVEHRGRRRSTR